MEEKQVNPEKKTEEVSRPYDPDFAKVAELLVAAGATQKKTAQILGIKLKTLRSWKKKYPEFKVALNKGKEGTRTTLAFEGLKRAIGYEFVEYCEKPVRIRDGDGNLVWVNHTYKYTKHQPGDSKLLFLMLVCLDRYLGGDLWRDAQKLEIETKTLTPPQLAEAQSKQINDLAGKLQKAVAKKSEVSNEM